MNLFIITSFLDTTVPDLSTLKEVLGFESGPVKTVPKNSFFIPKFHNEWMKFDEY